MGEFVPPTLVRYGESGGPKSDERLEPLGAVGTGVEKIEQGGPPLIRARIEGGRCWGDTGSLPGHHTDIGVDWSPGARGPVRVGGRCEAQELKRLAELNGTKVKALGCQADNKKRSLRRENGTGDLAGEVEPGQVTEE